VPVTVIVFTALPFAMAVNVASTVEDWPGARFATLNVASALELESGLGDEVSHASRPPSHESPTETVDIVVSPVLVTSSLKPTALPRMAVGPCHGARVFDAVTSGRVTATVAEVESPSPSPFTSVPCTTRVLEAVPVTPVAVNVTSTVLL
jgi:hypothetical protein